MSNIFNKIVAKSNSYKYYKNKAQILDNQVKTLKKREKEFKKREKKLKKINKQIKNELNYIKIQNNIESLKNKSSSKKITILFILYFRTSGMDSLVKLLENDDLFDPIILIIPHIHDNYDLKLEKMNEIQIKEYNDNYKYFNSKGFKTIKGFDEVKQKLVDIEHEITPDIIFFLSPWETEFPSEYNIRNLPENVLYCYIPYGMDPGKIENHLFNRPLHNKAWKIFSQTPKHKKLASKYSDIGTSNMVVTGFPKMDPLIDGSYKNMPKVWKNKEKIKIIWAPHFSVGNVPQHLTHFSTFLDNHKFFYEYAKSHPETEWVFKPHPKLIYTENRVPDDENFNLEYLIKYYESWDNLPNATLYLRGDYLNLFMMSDAMITDSMSFLAEYLYFNKPGLLLTRKSQKYNEFGESIIKGWYQEEGKNLKGIESFINDVLIEKEDYLKDTRLNIYNMYLNTNGITASENIYKYLKKKLINYNEL